MYRLLNIFQMDQRLKLDVLMCVESRDVDYLFPFSLQSCIQNFSELNILSLVTNDAARVSQQVLHLGYSNNVNIIDDREILTSDEYSLPGWYRQQIIKLKADMICQTDLYCCMGSDTILLKQLGIDILIDSFGPILYFNRYPYPSKHLEYERGRVEEVSKILKVEPVNSFILGDFIIDIGVFDRKTISQLRNYLESLYGDQAFFKLLHGKGISPFEKKTFGEWTLWAVYILDVLHKRVTIKNSNSLFMRQVHNERVLSEFEFDSYAVHFVDKFFDLEYIANHLRKCGINI